MSDRVVASAAGTTLETIVWVPRPSRSAAKPMSSSPGWRSPEREVARREHDTAGWASQPLQIVGGKLTVGPHPGGEEWRLCSNPAVAGDVRRVGAVERLQRGLDARLVAHQNPCSRMQGAQ